MLQRFFQLLLLVSFIVNSGHDFFLVPDLHADTVQFVDSSNRPYATNIVHRQDALQHLQHQPFIFPTMSFPVALCSRVERFVQKGFYRSLFMSSDIYHPPRVTV